ncbi:MAG: hypothetical protein WAN72_05675 [Candidatus Acidiferrales bacterium]
MNRSGIVSIAAIAVVLCCLNVTGKHVTSVNKERELWAESLSNEHAGIFFSSSGSGSRTLNISLMPDRRDPGDCDSVMATLLVRQDFLFDAYDRGFRFVSCNVTAADGKVTTLKDKIVPPQPNAPASPAPQPDPARHDKTPSEATA